MIRLKQLCAGAGEVYDSKKFLHYSEVPLFLLSPRTPRCDSRSLAPHSLLLLSPWDFSSPPPVLEKVVVVKLVCQSLEVRASFRALDWGLVGFSVGSFTFIAFV